MFKPGFDNASHQYVAIGWPALRSSITRAAGWEFQLLAGIEGADWGGLQRCQDCAYVGSAIIPAVCCVPVLWRAGHFYSHGRSSIARCLNHSSVP